MIKKEKTWNRKTNHFPRNWKVYHEELIIRGEFFFNFDFLENWDLELKMMNRRKVGRPYEYPNSLFHWLSPIHSFLDSRKLEGAMKSLSKFIPKLKACDHSTIIHRLNQLDLSPEFDKTKEYQTAVDGTGIKFSNRGEYIRHKWKVKRGWIKTSIVIDRFTKELLDVEVCIESTTDVALAKKHLSNLKDVKIKDMAADGAYYELDFYEALKKQNILPVIKMRIDASTNGLDSMHKAVREMKKLGGYEPWRDKFKYSHRWNIEGYNSSTKRLFGENVKMHKLQNCLKEAKHKFVNYERMKKYAQGVVRTMDIFLKKALLEFFFKKITIFL